MYLTPGEAGGDLTKSKDSVSGPTTGPGGTGTGKSRSRGKQADELSRKYDLRVEVADWGTGHMGTWVSTGSHSARNWAVSMGLRVPGIQNTGRGLHHPEGSK